jgi:CRP/FNR family transcriptional regulator, cyclic AMP receptor protein
VANPSRALRGQLKIAALQHSSQDAVEQPPRRSAEESNPAYRALISSGIFTKTEHEAVAALSEQLKPARFPRGHTIVDDSAFGGCLYVVMSGKVKVCLRRSGQCEFVVNILGPADIFGAVALFGANSRGLCVTALTEVLAVPIARDQFRAWLGEWPEIGGQMLRLLARWTKMMTECFADFASADAQARLASRLLFLRKRFGWQEGDEVRVVHDMTPDDFSLLVGVAPESIGPMLRDFEYRGWIRLEGDRVTFVDTESLKALPVWPMSWPGVGHD